jgi:hypothetical protein
MTPEIANIIRQFLQRVELKGAEVDAYVTVQQELLKIIQQPQQELEIHEP